MSTRSRRVLMIAAVFAVSRPLDGQSGVVVQRVQQLVNAGNRAGARALADSALSAAPAGSEVFAEALYARAYASADAAAAERDYVRLTIEFPRSPRLEDALFLSGQFRMARNDRSGARRQFERIVLEFPEGPNVVRAAFWAGRFALEDGDLAQGCAALALASEREQSDVELRNEIEYVRARCRAGIVEVADLRRTDSVAVPGATVQPPYEGAEYSVQVAAFARRSDANALGNRLKKRGFQARVVGSQAPYRVRVGRYASRELAVEASRRMKRASVNGIVVEAEQR